MLDILVYYRESHAENAKTGRNMQNMSQHAAVSPVIKISIWNIYIIITNRTN